MRVVSGVRDVARLDASHATPAASAADSRGDAEVSTAAAGTSATNRTDEQYSVRMRGCSSIRWRNRFGKQA